MDGSQHIAYPTAQIRLAAERFRWLAAVCEGLADECERAGPKAGARFDTPWSADVMAAVLRWGYDEAVAELSGFLTESRE